jgi:hydrogenase expression/formation protein HypD
MTASAADWLARIRALPLPARLRVMNVCGGHERSISMAGLRRALPPAIELIPGPGCPVCVCPEEDIHAAIELGLERNAMVVAFGDMLRVPCNAPKGAPRSLEGARAQGAAVRAIASPSQAAEIAAAHPDRQVVFFAAGFETTMAPVAALVAQGLPPNLSLLLAGRLTWPAVAMLLESGDVGFDALIAPGHVSTVMGAAEWRFVPERFAIPTAIAGFTPASLLLALYSVARQVLEGRPVLDNCYRELVRDEGNPGARAVLARAFDVVDANWRGIGTIARSGFALRSDFASFDARRRFALEDSPQRKRAGAMPPGCDCARVVLGRITPNECVLYGRACTPRSPVGPCMVSDEGACRIWMASGIRAGTAVAA